jgi:hypothetical protein
LANLVVLIVGAVTIALSVIVGFVAFLALAGLVLILATVFGIRAWWLRRKLNMHRDSQRSREPSGAGPKAVIEGEFRVVGKEDRQDPAP